MKTVLRFDFTPLRFGGSFYAVSYRLLAFSLTPQTTRRLVSVRVIHIPQSIQTIAAHTALAASTIGMPIRKPRK
jgi:hypothetical protein